MQNSKTKQNII